MARFLALNTFWCRVGRERAALAAAPRCGLPWFEHLLARQEKFSIWQNTAGFNFDLADNRANHKFT